MYKKYVLLLGMVVSFSQLCAMDWFKKINWDLYRDQNEFVSNPIFNYERFFKKIIIPAGAFCGGLFLVNQASKSSDIKTATAGGVLMGAGFWSFCNRHDISLEDYEGIVAKAKKTQQDVTKNNNFLIYNMKELVNQLI